MKDQLGLVTLVGSSQLNDLDEFMNMSKEMFLVYWIIEVVAQIA